MAKIYAALIQKGLKSFQDVPEQLKEQVKELLVSLGLGHLAE